MPEASDVQAMPDLVEGPTSRLQLMGLRLQYVDKLRLATLPADVICCCVALSLLCPTACTWREGVLIAAWTLLLVVLCVRAVLSAQRPSAAWPAAHLAYFLAGHVVAPVLLVLATLAAFLMLPYPSLDDVGRQFAASIPSCAESPLMFPTILIMVSGIAAMLDLVTLLFTIVWLVNDGRENPHQSSITFAASQSEEEIGR